MVCHVAASPARTGECHSLVCTVEGEVFSFGGSTTGALGQGDVRRITPTLIQMTSTVPIRQVACGRQVSFLLTDFGDLFSFGCHARGQCGLGAAAGVGDKKAVVFPTRVESLEGLRVRSIVAGDEHAIAVVNGASRDMFNQSVHDSFSRSDTHTETYWDGPVWGDFNPEDETVFSWGANTAGQCGLGKVTDQFLPVQIVSLRGQGIASVDCGSQHTIVVLKGGKKVLGFGSHHFGQLGLGPRTTDEPHFTLPTPIPTLCGNIFRTIVQVACAGDHSLFLDTKNEVLACGSNSHGQLGFLPPGDPELRKGESIGGQDAKGNARAPQDGYTYVDTPSTVAALKAFNVKFIATAHNHTVVLTGSDK